MQERFISYKEAELAWEMVMEKKLRRGQFFSFAFGLGAGTLIVTALQRLL